MPGTINTSNKVNYSQVQTQDYDQTLIQRYVNEYTNNVSTLLSQKDNYQCLATLNNPSTQALPYTVVLSQAVDDFATYNLDTGLFVTPRAGIFLICFYTDATPTIGAPTAFFVDIVNSENANTATFAFPLIAGSFHANVVYPIFLNQDSTIKIQLRADAAATVLLSINTRLYVSWR